MWGGAVCVISRSTALSSPLARFACFHSFHYCNNIIAPPPRESNTGMAARASARRHEAPMPPGFLSSWYAQSFQKTAHSSPRETINATALLQEKRAPTSTQGSNDAVVVAELRSRLEGRVSRLLMGAVPPSAVSAATASAGPPSARLADVEKVSKPTEAEVLTRILLPVLQLTLDDDAVIGVRPEAAIFDLCFDELIHFLGKRAPEFKTFVHAIRVGVDAALQRRQRRDSVHETPIAADARMASQKRAANVQAYEGTKFAQGANGKSQDVALAPRAPDATPETGSRDEERPEKGEDDAELPPQPLQMPEQRAQEQASAEERKAKAEFDLKHGVTYAEDDWLEKLYAAEDAAAAKIQRQRRYMMMQRALPIVRLQAREILRQKQAAITLQGLARGFLSRTYKLRAFRRARAVRQIQHAERRRSRNATRRQLLRDGRGLSEASVQRALAARDTFLLLSESEREVLIPSLLAVQSGTIEALTQAGDLWSSLAPLGRARAIVDHLAQASPSERTQIVRLCVQSCSATELLGLLGFISEGASKHWGLARNELVQTFLQEQPQRIAALAEDKLLDGIVETLPADAVARSMQRLALFAHLPPIRSRLPIAPKPFERISQAPNPPPRSARRGPAVAGGVFGPPPVADKPYMPAQETSAPPPPSTLREAAQHTPIPPATSRAARNPRALERQLANRR